MNLEPLQLTELETDFVQILFKFLLQNDLDPKRIAIDRKSDNTLNFQVDGRRQFGRIKLKGRKTKMQVMIPNDKPIGKFDNPLFDDDIIYERNNNTTWYEDKPFDFYIEQLPHWINYIQIRKLYK